MTGALITRGLPECIKNDGWWLTDAGGTLPSAPKVVGKDPRVLRSWRDFRVSLMALLIMTALADLSFWKQELGLSIAVFCIALSAVMVAMKPERASKREWAGALGWAVVCNLPVVEHVQAFSIGFSIVGLAGLLAWVVRDRLAEAWQVATLFFRASTQGTLLLPRLAAEVVLTQQSGVSWRNSLQTIALPLSVGLVFLLLFASANPLLEAALEDLLIAEWFSTDLIWRVTFWIVIACLVFPYLRTQWLRETAPASPGPAFRVNWPQSASGMVNARSVTLSLVLFNAMFFAQTMSDIAVLAGGMELPRGMTYSEYAHRGAYPLLVTALLAGLFSVATHKMVREQRMLRWMVYAWLGQTLFLVLTASFRLQLYVHAYALTHLRIAAFIWMGLVLIGLCLVIVQIAKRHSVGWLFRYNAVAAAVTLYLCCFVNFTHIIADFNLTSGTPLSRVDYHYLCSLGEQAIPAIMEHGPASYEIPCRQLTRPMFWFDPIDSWQEWGFRRWRLQLYLAEHRSQ